MTKFLLPLVDSSPDGAVLDEDTRKKYEVFVPPPKGLLVDANGKLIDTSRLIAHHKEGYAAFILTEDERLFIFPHFATKEGLKHVSFSQGKPVMGAGEIIVKNGVVTIINSHSGHYKPSLFAIKQLIDFFIKKGMDIAKTEIETFVNTEKALPELKSKQRYINLDYTSLGFPRFYISASKFSKLVDSDSNQLNYKKIIMNLDSQESGYLTSWYKFVEGVFFSAPRGLTDKRSQLRKEVSSYFKEAQAHADKTDPHAKIDEIIRQLDDFNAQNARLSKSYGKQENSGRLSQTIALYKKELLDIKEKLNKAGRISEDIKSIR